MCTIFILSHSNQFSRETTFFCDINYLDLGNEVVYIMLSIYSRETFIQHRMNVTQYLPRPVRVAKAVDLDSCFAGAFVQLYRHDQHRCTRQIESKSRHFLLVQGDNSRFLPSENSAVKTILILKHISRIFKSRMSATEFDHYLLSHKGYIIFRKTFTTELEIVVKMSSNKHITNKSKSKKARSF